MVTPTGIGQARNNNDLALSTRLKTLVLRTGDRERLSNLYRAGEMAAPCSAIAKSIGISGSFSALFRHAGGERAANRRRVERHLHRSDTGHRLVHGDQG